LAQTQKKDKIHPHRNIDSVVGEADVLVAAVGRKEFVRGDWIKPGCAVIDCGINPTPDASKKSGVKLFGDVAFEEAKGKAGQLTPVPGGVGPMTVALLMNNTVLAAKRIQEKNGPGGAWNLSKLDLNTLEKVKNEPL